MRAFPATSGEGLNLTLVADDRSFGAGFNAADVRQSAWGEITVEFTRCDAATLRWQSDIPGFGRGTRNLQKLAGIVDADC